VAGISPFGKEARVQILRAHFEQAAPVTPGTAWKFVYQELLWIDGSTGLAHLYESDKAQQGRRWYRRSLVFTRMLCERFGNISTEELRQQIDRLFRACLEQLVKSNHRPDDAPELAAALDTLDLAVTPDQPTPIADSAPHVYVPDADLVAEFARLLTLEAGLQPDAAARMATRLVARARLYFTVERKRQNVLGEGFEDLLQLLMVQVGHVPADHILIRTRANKLPGFQKESKRARLESPDIAIVQNNRTALVASVKWSLRHDRQKQLSDELDCYAELLSQDTFPQYVLITNEYDPGRLINAAGLVRSRGGVDLRVDYIYHVNVELLLGVLQDHERVKDLIPLVQSGRIRSLAHFLSDLSAKYRS
jgi:hypothetical protein